MRPDHRVGMNLRSKGGLTILLLLLLVIWLLGGCSSPKTFDSWRKSAKAVHVVRPGDTLYSIARANNIDYRQLARWNNIRAPNRIYVGQRIRLTPPPAGGSVVSTASASSHPASKSVSPSRQSVSPSRQSVSPSRQSVSPSR
ncbi:MAG TPA: LysM domain-containing protein, partial [Halothiobacillus sp.]|nr:LysM domain-containing protein [Halothiobacillus sp.]